MRVQITGVAASINTAEILRRRGLGQSTAAVKKLGTTIARYADWRVPMQTGALKNSKQIIVSGGGNGYIVYPAPYAHYQHEGKAMGGRAPKHYTGKALTYHGAPTRGSKWVDRTMKEDGKRILSDFAKAVGGKIK
ncbi:minor capsid protein [Butyricicoccus intestinisimiae]|uniref:Minor capsid protein n=1 Tax=Butyricicoccus intestinisimiae TaxID=2841509 RepID=A0ABS6ENH4_9FIRM|nr:minor capsid protein [Butyricicoccus intestinisimiae]MBU5489132.1 minor capsid protein [Butyricicoccus intestinisimiae]